MRQQSVVSVDLISLLHQVQTWDWEVESQEAMIGISTHLLSVKELKREEKGKITPKLNTLNQEEPGFWVKSQPETSLLCLIW